MSQDVSKKSIARGIVASQIAQLGEPQLVSTESSSARIFQLFVEFDCESHSLEWHVDSKSKANLVLSGKGAAGLASIMCDYYGVPDEYFEKFASEFVCEISRRFTPLVVRSSEHI